MSESVEMYLVMTALLRGAQRQPVAVSMLAGRLGVTQVSANEMCHKLSERGLLTYQPYKGVTLTEAGEAQAQAVLSRRRLWVIFLVANLGIDPAEADDLACQLEHITSGRLEVALRAFLERAPGAALGPPGPGAPPEAQPISGCAPGARGQIQAAALDAGTEAFLRGQGLAPGAGAQLLAVGDDGAALVEVEGRRVALAPSVAALVALAPAGSGQRARRETWARCSAFWACLHGEPCACRS